MLEKVGLSREHASRFPNQFSGGQRQRAGIARALILNPRLIIADECIAALDASVQAQIVNMLKRIQKETGTSFLFISHDLSMVRYLSDRMWNIKSGDWQMIKEKILKLTILFASAAFTLTGCGNKAAGSLNMSAQKRTWN